MTLFIHGFRVGTHNLRTTMVEGPGVEERTPRGRAVIIVNGERRTVESGSLQELLERLGLGSPRGGIAVAVNGRVVSRSRWAEQRIDDGDQVEIVGAVQGG